MGDQTHSAPPGWYEVEGRQRWWDGTQWAPEVPTPSAAPPEVAHHPEPDVVVPRRKGELRPDIERAMSRMSVKLGSKREIKRLEDHLWHDEMVEYITRGTYGPGTGVVVLTDRRLFFLKDGRLSKTSEDFPLEKISSVQWATGVLTGKIVVFASGNRAEITNVQKADGKTMTDALRARLTQRPALAPKQSDPTAEGGDRGRIYDELRRLGELRDAGVLTDQEFETQKAALLSQL